MSVFDTSWTPASRASDPQTSKDAEQAARLHSNKWQRLVVWAMVEREDHGANGTTASEAIMRLSLRGEAVPETASIARRITDLVRAGLVATVPGADGRPLTRVGGQGRAQQVYVTTPRGRAELAAVEGTAA